jgi:hypothetical protein
MISASGSHTRSAASVLLATASPLRADPPPLGTARAQFRVSGPGCHNGLLIITLRSYRVSLTESHHQQLNPTESWLADSWLDNGGRPKKEANGAKTTNANTGVR